MQVITLGSLLMFLSAGFVLAASKEGVNPFHQHPHGLEQPLQFPSEVMSQLPIEM